MVTRLPEMTLKSAIDGADLIARIFPVPEAPKAVLSLVHGLGEHKDRYTAFAADMAARDIAVVAIDLRGHGESMGPRGVSKSLDYLHSDIRALLSWTRHNFDGLPHFMMGHSMGGFLVLDHLLKFPDTDIAGVISQAPALAPVTAPSGLEIGLMGLLRPLIGSAGLPNRLDPALISSLDAEVEAYLTDPLVHDKIGVGLALDMIKTGAKLKEKAADFQKPLLMLHGSADGITSYQAARDFADAAGDICAFQGFEGAYHELHHEPCRDQVIDVIAQWIETRV